MFVRSSPVRGPCYVGPCRPGGPGDAAAAHGMLKFRDRAPPARTRQQERSLPIQRVCVEPVYWIGRERSTLVTPSGQQRMRSEDPPPGDAASRSLASSEVARRILARDALAPENETGSVTPETAILALQRSCIRVSDALRNSMGDAGCAALLARALARTEQAHPVLKDLH